MIHIGIIALLLVAASQDRPPAQAPAAEAPPQQPDETLKQRRAELNLLGATDASAGESKRNENIQFNLIDNNAQKDLNRRLGTTATVSPVFEAQNGYYGSEFGASVAKFSSASGQNTRDAWHGTLFETYSDSALSARSFFQVGGVQPAHENRYGVSLGGGLGRFGYLSIEGTQQKLRASVNGDILIPTPPERTVLTSNPATAAIVSKWLAAYPGVLPNRTDVDPHVLNTNAPQDIDSNAAGATWQLQPGPRDRLVAHYLWTTQNVDAFELLPGQNPDTSTRSHSSRLTWDHEIDSNDALVLSAGFDRLHSLLTPEPNSVGPHVVVGTVFNELGPGAEIPLDRVQNRFRTSALYRRRQGKFEWTAGWDVARLQYNGREVNSNRTNWYFRDDFGRTAAMNFALGIPSRFSTGIGELDRGFRFWDQGYFAGVRWQPYSSLTLFFNLRYEPVLAPSEVNGVTPVHIGCDCNNLAPRFGFAQRLPGSWGVVRGAYGWFYAPLPASTLAQLRWDPPAFHKIEVQAPDLLNPLAGLTIGPDTRVIFLDVPQDLKTPYSQQYNLAWEPQLPSNWKLSLGYVGSRTAKLYYQWYANRAVPVAGIPLTTDTVTQRRPDPRYYDDRKVRNMGRAYFDAARVNLTSPSWHGATFDLAYWFSKAIDTGANYTTLAAGEDPRNEVSQSEFGVQQDLRGPSVFDQRHALSLRWNYDLPKLRHSALAAEHWLGGWSASAVFLAKTGMPFTVFTGSDSPGHGNVDGDGGDRPDVVDPSVLGRTIANPDTARRLLPLSAFRFLTPGEQRGNLGWDTFRRGGIRNLNAALSRTWVLHREQSMTFRAESINLTNTPQFAEPISDMTSPAFGLITNTLNDGRSFQFTMQLRF
ncbi:MAG: hypothetical protein LAO79_15645 [Acidobacteriia bacterium]|nr:hypothetical protein [Terriglobia bacterium]